MSIQKHWCFTINENSAEPFSRTETPRPIWDPDTMDYLIFSMEAGTHVHLQGYVVFKKKCRMAGVKKLLKDNTVHVEPARGTPTENKAYCSKLDETHLEGPWEWGTLPACKGHRTDLDSAIGDIKAGKPMREVAHDNPATFVHYSKGLISLQALSFPSPDWRDLHVTWIWGMTGTGKTRAAYDSDPDLYKVIMPGQWYDGYDRQQTLLIDDFYGQIRCSDMLNILDGYKLQLPIKGGFTWAHWTRVFITSNVPPTEAYKVKADAHTDCPGIPKDVMDAFLRRIHEIITM